MSVFERRHDWLDNLEFKLGLVRGRLAALLDILSDAQITVGTHGAYCHSPQDSRKPTADIQQVMRYLDDAKELTRSLMKAQQDK